MIPYYDHGGITIYHGDCRDFLAGIEADCVFADPPYGVGFRYTSAYKDQDAGEYDALLDAVIPKITSAPIALVTPGMRHFWRWPKAAWMLAWHKPGATRISGLRGFNTWEPILFYGRVRRPFWQDAIILPDCVNHADDTGEHPCPKPLQLLQWLLNGFTSAEGLILDPFCGSGTTLRAAKNLGRRAIGIEIEERYCEIAAKRLSQEVLPL